MKKEYLMKVVVQTTSTEMSQEEFDRLAAEGILNAEIEANKHGLVRFHFNPVETQTHLVTNPEMPALPESFRKRRG